MNSETPLLDGINEYSISIKKLNEENIDYKRNLLALVSMGFDKRMIDALHSIYSINSLEQAINYLSLENGEWQHNYIDFDRRCFICLEDTDHLDYKSKRGNPIKEKIIKEKEEINDRISRKSRNSLLLKRNPSSNYERTSEVSLSNVFECRRSSLGEEEDEIKMKEDCFICGICFGEYEAMESFQMACKHEFCKSCWKGYIETIISEGKFALNCMQKGCNLLLEEEMVINLVSQAFYVKLKKNQVNKLVTTNRNMKFCPTVNCGGYAERRGEGDKNVTCTNGHNFCFNCLQAWHDKKSCNEILDQEFMKWKEGRVVKRCPNCQFWTEKNEGCNHMTCQNCSYNWCWLCIGKYIEGHYGPLGPCEGLQFGKERN